MTSWLSAEDPLTLTLRYFHLCVHNVSRRKWWKWQLKGETNIKEIESYFLIVHDSLVNEINFF